MFDLRKYYEKENDPVKSSYYKTLVAIKEVCNETTDYEKAGEKKEYYRFFNTVGFGGETLPDFNGSSLMVHSDINNFEHRFIPSTDF